MLSYILKQLHYLKLLNQNLSEQLNILQTLNQSLDTHSDSTRVLSSDLEQNLTVLQNILGTSNDIIVRKFNLCDKQKTPVALIYIEGMVNKAIINEHIVKPLMYDSRLLSSAEANTVETVSNTMLATGNVTKTGSISKLVESCLAGDTVVLIHGFQDALTIDARQWESRGVQEPHTEAVVRGPREGFTETLRINTALLRRKIHNPNFTLEMMKLGQRTKTDVCIAYVKGLAEPRLVREVRRRLRRIRIDAILESGYIEQFVEDAPLSPFATIANSEKPDVVAAKLLEGRVAILVDGTPIVLTVPMLFLEGFQSSEDYYSRLYYTNIVRILRFVSFFITTLGPALYVALTSFHQEALPTTLLVTLLVAKEGIPFPTVAEALLMGAIYEILREAGVRLPRPIGSAISIVGALVLGEAAVSAGLVGAPMVIVVAITAISSFVIPAQGDVTTTLRLVFTVAASLMGIYGISIIFLGVLIHLCCLRSFGTPYFSPFAPLSIQELKDSFLRAPLWLMRTRPQTITRQDLNRQAFRLKPNPPSETE